MQDSFWKAMAGQQTTGFLLAARPTDSTVLCNLGVGIGYVLIASSPL
jgi:hypothetical protein